MYGKLYYKKKMEFCDERSIPFDLHQNPVITIHRQLNVLRCMKSG